MSAEDNVRTDVFTMLSLLEDPENLMIIAKMLHITIPKPKQGNRTFILRILLRYLNSEEVEQFADEGHETFLELQKTLKAFFDESKLLAEIKADPTSTPKREHVLFDPTKPKFVSIQKLKDFKISRTIGSAGQKDKLSYSSLSYQIHNGKEAGYSDTEICAGVIRAIAPGNHLRTYLESRNDLKIHILIQIMRSHFKEKDSTSVFTELSNAVQLGSESAMEFTIRLMSLRQKVYSLSKEEDCPYEIRLVQKRFLHAISTGLKNNNIRHELRDALKTEAISDEELLDQITKAVANETEHSEKVY